MFNNKHVIAALIVTPLLSILGYFAVDFLVTEKSHAAVQGQSYSLIARSGCRYASGRCTLANGDFVIDIEAAFTAAGELMLTLHSAFPLRAGQVAVVAEANQTGQPVAIRQRDESRRQWSVVLPGADSEHRLQLAVSANGTVYFGETGLAFTHYETGFGKDFRSNDAGDDAR